jgi:hypothetical protein
MNEWINESFTYILSPSVHLWASWVFSAAHPVIELWKIGGKCLCATKLVIFCFDFCFGDHWYFQISQLFNSFLASAVWANDGSLTLYLLFFPAQLPWKGCVQLLSSTTILVELVVRLGLEGSQAAHFLLKQLTDIGQVSLLFPPVCAYCSV